MNLEPIHVGGDGADDPAGLDGAHRELLDLYNRIVWACHHEAAVIPIRERTGRRGPLVELVACVQPDLAISCGLSSAVRRGTYKHLWRSGYRWFSTSARKRAPLPRELAQVIDSTIRGMFAKYTLCLAFIQ